MKKLLDLLKKPKAKIVAAAGGGCAVVAAVVVAVLLSRQESYRTVAVAETNGTTLVVNETSAGENAYVGMHLYSGDDVTVQNSADLTLLLDMDKYVYAEEHTHFWLETAGSSDKGRTVIHLAEGSELNRLKNQLKEGESYQVDTPNSTMAVRGTVFRVTVYYDENGMAYTLIEVLDGAVQVDLKTVEGVYNGVSETLYAGEAALVRGNSDFAEFVVGEDGSVKQEIDYKAIPQETAKVLVAFIDDGEQLCIGKDLLMDYTGLAEHQMQEFSVIEEATCATEGLEGVVCAVCGEVSETRIIPKLSHVAESEWEVVTEPTCTTAGKRQLRCSICGQIMEMEEIAASGHVPGPWEVTREATCQAAGERQQVCTVCNEVVQVEKLDQLAHIPGEWQIQKENSCVTDGEQEKYCEVCGAVIETGVIPASGHTMGSWVTQSATCTSTGSRTRSCSACGYTESETIPMLAHTVTEWEVAFRAECETPGEQVGTCEVCHKAVTATIPATGHTYSIYVHRLVTEMMPSPENEMYEYGQAEYVQICTSCQAENSLGTHTVTYDGETYTCNICGGVVNVEQ